MFVGEAIAVVIAESRYLAEDAATMVEVEYEPLEPVSDCSRAIEPGAPRADTRKASNVVKEFRQTYGNVDAVFDNAPHRAELKLKTHRGVCPSHRRACRACDLRSVGGPAYGLGFHPGVT